MRSVEVKLELNLPVYYIYVTYSIGLLNNGRAITVAKNIAVATSYPAQPVINVRATEDGTGYPDYPKN